MIGPNNGAVINVLSYIPTQYWDGIRDGSNTTDLTTYFNNAKAEQNIIYFPEGTYLGNFKLWQSNFVLIGDGSDRSILKCPASVDDNVLELGDLASGNSAIAYTNCSVMGIGIDGNKANTPAPSGDLTGWGLGLTKMSYWVLQDVKVIDCHQGLGVFIDSNYGIGNALYIQNCGNSTQGTPGFDINSSKYCIVDVITETCDTGTRILDNSYGNFIRSSNYNSTRYGVVLSNQYTNWGNIANEFHLTVHNGCSIAAINIASEQYGNIIEAAIYDVDAIGMRLSTQGANVVTGTDSNPYYCILDHTSDSTTQPITGASYATYWTAGGTDPDTWVTGRDYRTENVSRSNVINLKTYYCQQEGLICYGHNNIINHTSYRDGRSGAALTYYCAEIYGDYNQLTFTIEDTPTQQVRGPRINSGAIENEVNGLSLYNLTSSAFTNSGTRTFVNPGTGLGEDVASAGSINLPWKGDVFNITGTTIIGTINGRYKRKFTLLFSTNVTLGIAGNLKLAGAVAFNATADDSITLYYDGTNCIELSRSVN